jgi:hypothetical protein
LNKKTIAHLSGEQEKKIKAGETVTVVNCSHLPCTGPTWCYLGCPTVKGCPTCTGCGEGSAC